MRRRFPHAGPAAPFVNGPGKTGLFADLAVLYREVASDHPAIHRRFIGDRHIGRPRRSRLLANQPCET
jgi:hypothetical protein